MLTGKKSGSGAGSTQRYVNVEEIRDGVIVLKNGGLRAVLLVSSLNFDLKSSQEQDAIIAQYQNFLNSLDFPVQIVVQSRRFNIDPYIKLLDRQEKQQENELLRMQIVEYRAFVKGLIGVADIMSKYFYVVVPFSSGEDRKSGLFAQLGGIFRPHTAVSMKSEMFETYRSQLYQRASHVAASLASTGVQTTVLGTEELIELMYQSYNPSLFTTSELKDVKSLELQR